jgi:hypothetical protein
MIETDRQKTITRRLHQIGQPGVHSQSRAQPGLGGAAAEGERLEG